MTNRRVEVLVPLIFCLAISLPSFSQKKSPPKATSSLCTQTIALDTVKQQILATRTFENSTQRIAVLVRSADLLWPHQQEKARAAFSESFDLATAIFEEKGNETTREGRMPVDLPDQRFKVITAIAKRDPVWAQKLSDQVLQDDKREAEQKTSKDPRVDAKSTDKLMSVAYSLAQTDTNASLTFARRSLRYTATIQLPAYLYRLVDINKGLADSFYQEALTAYASAPMDQFLYLSSYPFGNNREAGEMPIYTFYQVPKGFVPNPSLQKLFTQTLLNRIQQLVENPTEPIPGSRYSEAAQMWMALSRLESQVQTLLPELSPSWQQAKGSIFTMLSQEDHQRVTQTLIEPPKRTFDERIEEALKQTDPARRESGIALAILSGSDGEALDHVVTAADKIEDSALREQVLSRFYFNRAQLAIKNKNLDEARKLATKVNELDHRAYLYSQIVTESIKEARNDVEIREVLEEVLLAALNAPDTEVKARALLGVAYLYAKIDPNRSVSVLGDAVKSINRIESPDFSRDFVIKRIEGKSFGFYSTLKTPGFNPENAFSEMGKLDFDGTLYQAGYFSNKTLRSMTTLALVEPCLQQTPQTKGRTTKTKLF